MKILGISFIAFAALALAASGAAQAKPKCASSHVQGVGFDAGLAKQTAADTLKSGLAAGKRKAKGPITYACTGASPLVTCTASQRTCL